MFEIKFLTKISALRWDKEQEHFMIWSYEMRKHLLDEPL